MDYKVKSSLKKLLFVKVLWFTFLTSHSLYAQNGQWEFDQLEGRSQAKQVALDSMLVHLKNRWEIKLAYGKYFFIEQSRSMEEEELLSPTVDMNLWELMAGWHFSERLTADFTIGFQLRKDMGARPDLVSVFNGDEIEVEGAGIAFIPVHFGLKYYLTKKRFRPLIGLGLGTVLARAKYILAEGDITNGITRTENVFRDRSWTSHLSTGFDYRMGLRSNFNLDFSYYSSGEFKETIGGYLSYRGWAIQMGISFLL
ncbi:MAG: hypothetical protein AAFP19_02515 [Bacteroidota bacterium]